MDSRHPCNYVFDPTEHRSMVLAVTQRLFLYLAAFLVALLPVEATYAASGCAPMAEMNADTGDCSDCMDDEREAVSELLSGLVPDAASSAHFTG